MYSAEGRYYHTIQHVEDCLAKLELVSHCDTREALKIAIWFHDTVYAPLRTDNEEASAALAIDWLKSISAPPEFQAVVSELIIATDHKTEPTTEDEKLIIDIDLSILGSSEEDYDLYAKNIRREYAAFSVEEYAEGRTKVLRHFLQRPELYSTKSFRDQFEEQARSNLERELKTLGASE